MARRRKKKIIRPLHLSAGPLPLKLAAQFDGLLLVFCDASLRRHGGLAAVLFDGDGQAPLVSQRTVALAGSNELEFAAALFALDEAEKHFPGRPFALFSDNSDAIERLKRAQAGCAEADIAWRPVPDAVTLCWIKGHASCRGNALADRYAAEAAS